MKLQKDLLSQLNEKNEVPIDLTALKSDNEWYTVFFSWQRPLVYGSKEEAAQITIKQFMRNHI